MAHFVRGCSSYRIQRTAIPDREKALYRGIALYRPFHVGAEVKTATMPQTSWQDHLDAVRDGKWEFFWTRAELRADSAGRFQSTWPQS